MADFSADEKEVLRQWALSKGRGAHRRTCPACSKDRGHGSSLECLSATIDGEKVLFRCWHCERDGAVRLDKRTPSMPQPYTPPPPVKTKPKAIKEIGTGLDALALAFLKERGISQETAELYGVTWAKAYFLQIRRDTHAVAYPYHVEDKVVGHKARSTEEKDHVCAPALYSLFGLQNVDIDECSQIVICEGETDALACAEAGVPNPTSVPNGASSFTKVGEDADAKATYGFLWTAKKQIDAAKKIIIATDADQPGDKLADELARRIGRHRCWRVKFPDGCKDANEVLLKHGKEALRKCVEDAEPWPVEGIYEASEFFPEVFDLFDNGFGSKVLTGLGPVDEIYSMGKGLLTVVTGIPGNGKSTFVDQLMINAARSYGHTFAICSFENPVAVHIGKLSQMLSQKHFFDTDLPGDKMTRSEMEATLPFIHSHFKFLQQDDGKKAGIDSIIERIVTAVFRWGVNGAVIDPYNYIARPKDMESETQFIDDVLSRLRLVAQTYDLHIWFIAHPTKMPMDGEGKYQIPKGYSISGSSAWFSKPDFGLTVHRDEESPGLVKIVNWKTRFDWLGRIGQTSILYDNMHHVYLADVMDNLLPYDADNSYQRYKGGGE